VASGTHWRLREYADHDASPPLLIVAAPIKRPYIWDLAPSVSAIRYCLRQRLRVCLLEWLPASHDNASNGLDEYAQAISECVGRVSDEPAGTKPFLIGHSLGGTLAAIFAAAAPQSIRGLVLLGAPLCFQPQTSQFRDALVSLVPSTLSETEPFPGSLLSQMSALASPGTFIWSRLVDAACSIADHHALDIHARVERWALDEVPLPGRLVHQIVEWLYRENRFCRGTLRADGRLIGPSSLAAPTLAVVNTADEVAPLTSVKPFTDAMPSGRARIIEYPGEVGVCLQHLGILVGRQARTHVWPEIVSWLDARR
jgi:polyhydroxyalkanoate synthase